MVLAFAARRRRCPSVNRKRFPRSCSRSPRSTRKLRFLLLQVLDDVLLTEIHPSGKHQHEKLQLQSVHGVERTSAGMQEVGRDRRPRRCAKSWNCSRFALAEFLRRTRSNRRKAQQFRGAQILRAHRTPFLPAHGYSGKLAGNRDRGRRNA
jgi:hypothetical protein